MPRGDRGKNYSAWLILGIVLTAVVALGFGANWLWSKKLEYNQGRDYRPDDYADQASGICIKLPPAFSYCPQEQSDTRAEAKRSDNDLKTQQEMADWAFAMVVASAAGLVLSIAGVGLVYATFRATRGQLAEAAIQSRVARMAVRSDFILKITGGALHDFRDTGRRPYITVTIENVGRSEANGIVIKLSGKFGDSYGDRPDIESFSDSIDVGSIGFSSKMNKAVVLAGFRLSEEVIREAADNAGGTKNIRLTVAATVEWDDIWGDHRSAGPVLQSGNVLVGPEIVRYEV